ncbi:MAG: MFS transporter [Trichodesmium sp. St2_bin6]|nr:MFS transporter [Trichodesmium sp. MAG_R01]MDE5072405.1 MFS transporter [Trichodesmium sp. St5_bin8]MDE5078223.1 MFS transporter [Trichodesmium sp. St2_bin6]MDE5101460.1 MFS transporter [Trichodesmium sp. St19_bin2]
MQTFLFIWLGQVFSLLGSSLSEFALAVWVYQTTGSITHYALLSLFIHLPSIFISPFAGAMVDRWSRRQAMIVSDSITGVTALAIMFLVFSQQLQVWHIYIAVGISSVCNAFQWPAYISVIPQLVPQKHLSRANGMVQGAIATARILGPSIAGVLIIKIHLHGILLIDFSTYLLAFFTLLSVKFPRSQQQKIRRKVSIEKLWQEVISGWNYVVVRTGLRQLTIFFGVIYLSAGILQVLFLPMVLSFASEKELGIVMSVSGIGMLLGSVIVSLWGCSQRRIEGILVFVFIQGLCLCLGGLKPAVIWAAVGGFGYLCSRAIVVSLNHTIWQQKVPQYLQGRVFSLQNMMEKFLLVITHLSAAPLVEFMFKPLMSENGILASSVGRIIGVGDGRGIALLFVLMGLLNIGAVLVAYRAPQLRRVEIELNDTDRFQVNKTETDNTEQTVLM